MWNFITFLVVGCGTLCLCCTCCMAPCGWIGIVTHSCGFFLTFASVILTGIFRYSDAGKICAENEVEYEINPTKPGEGTFKFSDHGDMIQGMFITLCVILCGMDVMIYIMIIVSRGIMAVSGKDSQQKPKESEVILSER